MLSALTPQIGTAKRRQPATGPANCHKRRIDDIDIHRGHRQRLCDGEPRHIAGIGFVAYILS